MSENKPEAQTKTNGNGKKVVTATYKHGGLSVRRVITAKDQKQLGVEEGAKQLVWERDNNWTVNIADVHPLVRKYLESDNMFVVEEHAS